MEVLQINNAEPNEILNKLKEVSKKTRMKTQADFSRYYPPASDKLKAKAIYMQSPMFWRDPHNELMLRISDSLMAIRDAIAEEIAVQNTKSNSLELVQTVSGYTIDKRTLEMHPEKNFLRKPIFNLENDIKFYFEKIKLRSLARPLKRR